MHYDPRNIDAGVRAAVVLLNDIPGVTTRTSCEGACPQPARHAHAALAYVAMRHPMPLRLQDFLVQRLGTLARIEADGIYCRWPRDNRVFAGALESAARLYLNGVAMEPGRRMRWPLTRLRARLARLVVHGHAARIGLCLVCAELVNDPHAEPHAPIPLVEVDPDLQDHWFAEFVKLPQNALDPALIATDGWGRLLARTQRGDFGTSYLRRWLRHRAHMIAHLTTRGIRHGVAAVRRDGVPLDFFYDDTHAVFVWNGSGN